MITPVTRTLWTLLMGTSGAVLLVVSLAAREEVIGDLLIIAVIQLVLALTPWIIPILSYLWQERHWERGFGYRGEQSWRRGKSFGEQETTWFDEEERVWEEVRAQLKWASYPGETYYDVLGVSRAATQDEIKKAYREKITQYHPDRFVNQSEVLRIRAEKISKKLNEAYGVLADPDKRREYDSEL